MRSLILVSLVVVVLAMRRPSCPRQDPGRPRTSSASGEALPVSPETCHHDPAHRISGRVGEHPWRNPALLCRRNTLPAVSSLWTPGGEHPVEAATGANQEPPTTEQQASRTPPQDTWPAGTDDLGAEDSEQLAARLEKLRNQLVSTPAEMVIANHAYGLFELAAIHLSQKPPRLDDARLAVDAMASLVENLGGRLGEPEQSLRDALSQIRLAFVQISGASSSANGETTQTETTQTETTQ